MNPDLLRAEHELRDGWLEAFAAEGVAALERLLLAHARFRVYLEERGKS